MPAAPKDVRINSLKIGVTVPADSSTGVFQTVETRVSTEQGTRKMIVLGAYFYPKTPLDDAPNLSAVNKLALQVAIGEQTALLDNDDPLVIAHLSENYYTINSSDHFDVFPKKLWQMQPRHVLSSQLTVGVKTAADNAEYDSQDFIFELAYLWGSSANASELIEFLQEYGLRS